MNIVNIEKDEFITTKFLLESIINDEDNYQECKKTLKDKINCDLDEHLTEKEYHELQDEIKKSFTMETINDMYNDFCASERLEEAADDVIMDALKSALIASLLN